MTNFAKQIVMRKPDDMHVHFRDGEDLKAVVGYTAKQFARAIIMPNLTPPVVNCQMAIGYLSRILEALSVQPGLPNFYPLMTIYLTDATTPEDIARAKESNLVYAAKLYPAHATTNSAHGVTDIRKLTPVLKEMERVGLVLCVHGETLVSTMYGDKTRNGRVGQLRREAVFLKETSSWLVDNFPNLKIVHEHITTLEAVSFVKNAPNNVAATITPQHLLETLDAVFESHHNKCMPVLKEEQHRQALLSAIKSGNPKFFCGTDTAPHAKSKKETHCGCAGCFTATHAVELYATAFEECGALDKLECFMSEYGAHFYGLPLNEEKITLSRTEFVIPTEVPYGNGEMLVPFWAGKTLNWKVTS